MTAPADSTLRTSFDKCSPNTLADLLRKIALGSLLAGQITQVRRKINMDSRGTSSYTLATLDCLVLPAHAKATTIERATVRAGGVTGELTIVAYGTTPTTGQIAVAPNGDIVTLGTDAITDMDVVYHPSRADVIESTFPVTTNAITLPTAITAKGVVNLVEVEALVGGSVGKKIVLIPGGSPSAGQAALDVAKAVVNFAAADAVTRARVKLSITAAEDLCTLLESTATIG